LLKFGVNEKKNFPVGYGPAKQIMLSALLFKKNELIEPPRFIPTIDFVSAIKPKDYPVYKAKNLGWNTIFKTIPKEEMPSKPAGEVRLEDFI